MAKWNLDKAHSELEFKVKHMMISNVKGAFLDFDVKVDGNAENLTAAHVDVEIKTASVNTKSESRDEHLRGADFFNSENYPEAQFVVTAINKGSNGTYRITGDLTIKGITHAVGFDAQVSRAADTVSATGKVVVDRTKYGMRFRSGNFFKDLGDTLIYNDFDLNVNITAKAV